ncbi:MAG: fructose-bisphosphate aldolase [Thaumarchaeota archaeon]|nr:fructose-bisphosphate aldolase [Nitrososphaerota archaeon]
MSQIGKEIRLGRIFGKDNRALIVAMDHAYIYGPIQGLEKPREVIEQVIEGGADAILTTYGVIRKFYDLMKGRVGIILRIDGGGSKYIVRDWSRLEYWSLLYRVEDAVKLGVDAVINTVPLGAACEPEALRITARIAAECEYWGMPLASEIIPVGGLSSSDPEVIATAARIGAEYGADMIKTEYTGDAESFRKVVERCPVPVLIAGGPKMETTKQVLETVKDVIDSGGAGIFFGRNIFQHKDPKAITRALRMIIHENASVDEALRVLD